MLARREIMTNLNRTTKVRISLLPLTEHAIMERWLEVNQNRGYPPLGLLCFARYAIDDFTHLPTFASVSWLSRSRNGLRNGRGEEDVHRNAGGH
jgi:hypothetical protein